MTYNARGDLYVDDYCGLEAAYILPSSESDFDITAFSCGYSGDGGPAISAAMNNPVGVATDSNGYIYVADSGNNAVRIIYPDAIFSSGLEQ